MQRMEEGRKQEVMGERRRERESTHARERALSIPLGWTTPCCGSVLERLHLTSSGKRAGLYEDLVGLTKNTVRQRSLGHWNRLENLRKLPWERRQPQPFLAESQSPCPPTPPPSPPPGISQHPLCSVLSSLPASSLNLGKVAKISAGEWR